MKKETKKMRKRAIRHQNQAARRGERIPKLAAVRTSMERADERNS